MKANTSTSNLTLASKTSLDSKKLIEKLFSVVKDCPMCLSKLKEEAGVNQTPAPPTGHADDDTTPAFQAKSDINDLYKRRG